jgi:hypothetical protein
MEMNYKSFADFYPFYLSQHGNRVCRFLHFTGLIAVFLVVFYSIYTSDYRLLIFAPIIGYGLAWIGHFFFEKNRPATFKYPLYSLMGDFRMFWDIILGKVKLL